MLVGPYGEEILFLLTKHKENIADQTQENNCSYDSKIIFGNGNVKQL